MDGLACTVKQETVTPIKARPTSESLSATPTSNLMMLVCAASVATPANVKEKIHFGVEVKHIDEDLIPAKEEPASPAASDTSSLQSGVSENSSTTRSTREQASSTAKKRLPADPERTSVSRKDKSLGLLCRKFLEKYPEQLVGSEIFLDDVSRDLDVERRRVYDIVNVFEGMEMLIRVAKNKYIWKGKTSLLKILQKLKALALEMYGCGTQAGTYARQDLWKSNFHTFSSHSIDIDFDERFRKTIQKLPKLKAKDNSLIINSKDFGSGENSRKEKSLGILCQKFLMLFIILPDNTVSLEKAAKILIDGDDDCCKSKTKVRRLYDIANILASMHLVEKTAVYDGAGRKAAFRWIGENLDELEPDKDALIISPEARLGFTKHSMFGVGVGELSLADAKRKLQSRSMSAHALNASAYKIGLPRTLSSSTIEQGKIKANDVSMGEKSSSIDVSKISLFRSPARLNTKIGNTVSPNERMFREEVRRLRERYPTKMPEPDGLLQLLTACKNDDVGTEVLSAPTSPTNAIDKSRRRRLLERFDSDSAVMAKKTKYVTSQVLSSQSSESFSTDGDSRNSSDLLSLAEVATENASEGALDGFADDDMVFKETSDGFGNFTKVENTESDVRLKIGLTNQNYSKNSGNFPFSNHAIGDDSECDQELHQLTNGSTSFFTSDRNPGSSSLPEDRYSHGSSNQVLKSSIGIQTGLNFRNNETCKRNASTSTSPAFDNMISGHTCQMYKHFAQQGFPHSRSVASNVDDSDKENMFHSGFKPIGVTSEPHKVDDFVSTCQPDIGVSKGKLTDIPSLRPHVPFAIGSMPVSEAGIDSIPHFLITASSEEKNKSVQFIPIPLSNVFPPAEMYEQLRNVVRAGPLMPLSPINASEPGQRKVTVLKTPIPINKALMKEETPSNFKFGTSVQRKLPTSPVGEPS